MEILRPTGVDFVQSVGGNEFDIRQQEGRVGLRASDALLHFPSGDANFVDCAPVGCEILFNASKRAKIGIRTAQATRPLLPRRPCVA